MSFAFAGALQGLGGGLMKVADERRKLAADLMKMEEKERMMAARRSGGGGSGGGAPGGGKPRALTNTESDNLARLYKNYDETGAFGEQAPSMAEFEAEVERLLPSAGSLSQAAETARSTWGGEDVTTTTQKERAALSPMRLFDDDGKYEETKTERKYGFRRALGGDAPDPDAEQGAAAAEPAPDQEEALKQARMAIRKGADPEQVKQRLREMGIEPRGL